jgi:hypothetical protein
MASIVEKLTNRYNLVADEIKDIDRKTVEM